MIALEQHLYISENKIITPLIEVIHDALPSPETKAISPTLKQSLDDLFPEQLYDEKNIQEAIKILGDIANEFNHYQLKDELTKVQCLAEGWLDDFERGIFGGKTLNELLHEKGGM